MKRVLKILKNIKVFSLAEIILAASGILLLISVGIVFLTGSFVVWTIAKIVYAVGVVMVVVEVIRNGRDRT